jgi:CheY-like chemotaxis protein
MSEQSILLVEDTFDEEVLIVRAIKKSNLVKTVVVAHDGLEAIDYLFGTGMHEGRDLGLQPGVILLDLNLPRMDGLEVLRRVRADERTKRLLVVMLTASKKEQDLFQSYDLGANSYIRKPVDFCQFSELMREVGSYLLVLNEAPPSFTTHANGSSGCTGSCYEF